MYSITFEGLSCLPIQLLIYGLSKRLSQIGVNSLNHNKAGLVLSHSSGVPLVQVFVIRDLLDFHSIYALWLVLHIGII